MLNKYKSLIYLVSISLFSFSLIACGSSGGVVAKPFKIKVRTTNPGSSSDVQFQIPTTGSGYNYNVDCDSDGKLEATGQTSDYICNYDVSGPGDYVISISGKFPQIFFNDNFDAEKIIEIKQWGTGVWRSMNFAFEGCLNMISVATDKPNITQVTDLRAMFYGTKFNQNINDWDVSKVTDMGYMFGNEFNQALDHWNVSNVTDMGGMFSDSPFNQDISGWNVANVTNMYQMFSGTPFNQDISGWNVSSVSSMGYMFTDATNFNQNLGNWDVSSVRSMVNMFYGVTLSPANYDSLLQGWSSRNDLQQNISFHAGNSVTGTVEGSQARASLRSNFGWTIIDGNSP